MTGWRLIAVPALLLAIACEDRVEQERELASFEVRLLTPTGANDRRCILPGTPTTGIDLAGCPIYERDASGRTVATVEFEALAIDNHGELLETYNSIASVRVVPGTIVAGFESLRFTNGVAQGDVGAARRASFRGAFGKAALWVEDDRLPPRDTETPGLGLECSRDSEGICAPFGLACINTSPTVGFDPQGLAYCSVACNAGECPEGFFCSEDIQAYADRAIEVDSGACVRRQPTYAVGSAGPMYFVEPNLADVNRADSLIESPFEEEFVEVKRGRMVVTAVRIDGFYLTDMCPLLGRAGVTEDPLCSAEELTTPAEFNHLFVFNFSRPDELFFGDQLLNVSGPMSEFNGLTEMNFPLWEVDYDNSPATLPAPIDLSERIMDWFPYLLPPGQRCFSQRIPEERMTLFDCSYALERLEAARVQATVESVLQIQPGSEEERNLERFGQWPVTIRVEDGMEGRTATYQLITRENIPFFDPRSVGGRMINQPVIGNLRQVAFDDRSDPIWIIEPRDQNDCPWCVN